MSANALVPDVANAPKVVLNDLDQLWFQVAGTLCNLSCTHCFNESGPHSTSFGHLGLPEFRRALEDSLSKGVREYYFTGGEPFLNRDLPVMVAEALDHGPVTVLTNGTVLPDRTVGALKRAEEASLYSLEFRVSMDGESAERNDPIRGEGTFEKILSGVITLHEAGFLPILTVTQTWPIWQSGQVLEELSTLLIQRGYDRPRIKVLPSLKIGREVERSGPYAHSEAVSEEMLADFDTGQLLCSHARIVTDRGIWVCPILVLADDGRLGDNLDEATESDYALAHRACYTCWQYGAICSNFPSPGDVD